MKLVINFGTEKIYILKMESSMILSKKNVIYKVTDILSLNNLHLLSTKATDISLLGASALIP